MLEHALGGGIAAWKAQELDELRVNHAAANDALRCQEAPLSPELVEALYIVSALAEFTHEPRDETAVRRMLRGALDLHPDLVLDPGLAPSGSLLDALLQEARAEGPGPTAPLPRVGACRSVVDGRLTVDRASSRPVVLQLVDSRGEAQHNDWLWPGELPPELSCPSQPTAPALTPLAVQVGPPVGSTDAPEVGRSAGRTLLIAGGLGLGAGAGLSAGAWLVKQRYSALDESVPTDADTATLQAEADAMRLRGNVLATSGVASTAAALGLLGVGLVKHW